MTIQQKMRKTLEALPVPHKQIDVYGNQIVITSWSADAANKWAGILARFAKVRGVIRSVDYAKEDTQARRSTLGPATVDVWRTFAVIDGGAE